MTLEIREINTKKELKEFIKFPFELYKGNPYYVTPLIDFEMSTLLREKNPAFDDAEAKYWVVEKDGKIVGRIAAIILEKELKEKKLARFGWIDFIDDKEVSQTLLETAKSWAKSKGAKGIHGPMGFTDLDFEGALISGFDQIATQATIYNYSYYIDHFRAWNMEIAATWVELRGKAPSKNPEKINRAVRIIQERFKVKVKDFKNTKEMVKYASGVFEVLNQAYSGLYGYVSLTQKQIDYYVDQYFGFIRKEFVCIVVNENEEVVGFALTFPSLSKAFQKAKGSLYPFGFIHVLKAFFSNDTADLFLICVKPEYQKLGIHALIFDYLQKVYKKKGIKYMASGPMLEDNKNVLNTWSQFDIDIGKIKRSCFIKQF
ncbi:hypothetical protein SAMN05421640_0823 [Ekhidna lutea]|uniref:N-acetyltransferase domain-containing protein n=1 Tax=Ekhidna lutea TaxID=447679 RepID=A0A239FVB4_EKHLU|nr:GNAT family N-acetyltransferase [Ekhidna lutea]SNS60123.1 hypothetical protein SAMN05421640_0823 [Ekhidna lutea]